MSFLNGFLDNLASGALNPKGTLGDFQHAARMFVDDSHRLTPKVKFLYHVTFNINPDVTAVIPQLRQKHMNELNMLVKTAQLPAYNIQTDIKHQYNRKRVVQKRIDYQPVNISFHDDNFGVTTAMWEAYYRYYYRDGNYASVGPAGAIEPTNIQYDRGNSINGAQYRYGLDNDSYKPFFTSITISQLARKTYTSFTLINPMISSWQHDTMDHSASDLVQSQMTLDYETVHMSRGPIGVNGPKGFAEEHYDKTPSPISLAGGGASALLGGSGVLAGGMGVLGQITSGTANFGTVLQAANVFRNAGGLTRSGIGQELIGSAIGQIGQSAGIDTSGVAGIAFPKGGSGGDISTLASAAVVVGASNYVQQNGGVGAVFSKATNAVQNAFSGPNVMGGEGE